MANDRIYEELDPISRWTKEPGFDTLTIYLPGFGKEHLTVQVTSTRKLRVMGERRAAGNKWIRFRKEFPIQANVDVDAIAAKFEGVNLVVKLPRPEQKGKRAVPNSGDVAAKLPPAVHEMGPKPPLRQLPQLKEEASKGLKKVQELLKPPMAKPETSKGAKKDQEVSERPLMEKVSEKGEEASRGKEKTRSQKPAMEKSSKEPETKNLQTEKMKEKEKGEEKRRDVNELEPPCKVGGYKKVVGGYAREMKKNKRAMQVGLVVIASMLVMFLGIYAGQKLGSSIED